MYQRKDKIWVDTLPQPGSKSPKFFYGKTQAEVKRKMAAWKKDHKCGPVFSDALDEWLAYKEPLVAWNTYHGYEAPSKRLREAFGDKRLSEITAPQIQALIDEMAARDYGKTAVGRHYDIMNGVFKYNLIKPGTELTYNPCSAVQLPSLSSIIRELPAKEDVDIVKKSVHEPFGLFAYLLVYSGLRKGEALAITDKTIHDGIIDVQKQITWQPNKPVLAPPKTKKSIRKVPLLDALKKELPKEWTGYLFSEDGGKTPLGRKDFLRLWEGYCQSVGLADKHVEEHKGKNGHKYYRTTWTYHFVPHQLRHEFATICLDAEIEAKDAASFMGHSTPQITEQIYQHIREQRRKKGVDKLNKFINEEYNKS